MYSLLFGFTLWCNNRKFPDLRDWNKDLRCIAVRKVVNTIIQGKASNVIEDAMLTLASKAGAVEGMVVEQVHDEIVFDVPADAVEEFAPIVKEDMEQVREAYDLGCLSYQSTISVLTRAQLSTRR